MTRRAFLRNLGLAAAALGVPVAAMCQPDTSRYFQRFEGFEYIPGVNASHEGPMFVIDLEALARFRSTPLTES